MHSGSDATPVTPARAPVSRVIRLFRPYVWRLLTVFALIVTGSTLSLAVPFLLRAILDVALPRQRLGLLAMLAGGTVAVAVVNGVLSVMQSYLSLSVGQRVMDDLRRAVFGHLHRLSLAHFTSSRVGDVQSRIANDIGGMGQAVTSVATMLVSSLTTVCGSVVAMTMLSWRLTLISLLTVPPLVWTTRRVGRERRSISLARQEQASTLANLVEESLSVEGFLLTRVMGRSAARIEEFAGQSRRLAQLATRSSVAGRWRQSTVQVTLSVMPVVIYLAAGLTGRYWHLHISIGTLVAFTTLQQGLFGPSQQLMQVGIQMQSSLSLFDRTFEYLDLPVDVAEPEHPRPLGPVRGHVRFERVDFSYGGQPVLRGIDLDVPPGRHIAIVGPTGSGKTTLAHLLLRLYDVCAGRITVDGTDVRELSFADLSRAVGVISQHTHLIHATVAENLRFAKPDATAAELVMAATRAQVHDLIDSLPDGYQTVVGEHGHRFSGGERQRISIARTLLRNPPILILDEATSSLDIRTEQAVQRALEELATNRTTITIAHRLSTVRTADEIVVLVAGRIVERGTHDQLLEAGGDYATLIRHAHSAPTRLRSPSGAATATSGRQH